MVQIAALLLAKRKKMKINPQDISVVVQGAIDKNLTPQCLKSIRKHLPGAEIILSTWDGSDVSGLDYDKLVLNKDPGAKTQFFTSNIKNNVNRQLVSTQNGLKRASRKYTLKLRTDFFLTGNGFLQYFDTFPKRDKKYSFFEHRVVVPSVYSREFSEQTGLPIPFHPSDFWFFGLTTDLMNYFMDTDLMPVSDLANFKYKYPNMIPYPACTFRYTPEQYFCLSWVRRHIKNVKMYDWTDLSDEIIDLSKHVLANNFVFVGFDESGITSEKHKEMLKNEYNIAGIITHDVFMHNYQRYCDKDFEIPKSPQGAPLKHLAVHWRAFKMPIKRFFYWFGEIFSIIYYFIFGIIYTVRKLFCKK